MPLLSTGALSRVDIFAGKASLQVRIRCARTIDILRQMSAQNIATVSQGRMFAEVVQADTLAAAMNHSENQDETQRLQVEDSPGDSHTC